MYCRKCGKWIPDDSNYCNYCGNKITLDKKEKRAVWLLVLFIILCLIATYFPIRYLWKLKYPAPLDYEKLSPAAIENVAAGDFYRKILRCRFSVFAL